MGKPLGLTPAHAPRSTMARPAPILYQSVLALPSKQRGNKMTLPKARPCLRSPKGLRVGKLPSKGAEAGAGEVRPLRGKEKGEPFLLLILGIHGCHGARRPGFRDPPALGRGRPKLVRVTCR
jgi:hypothetical protein